MLSILSSNSETSLTVNDMQPARNRSQWKYSVQFKVLSVLPRPLIVPIFVTFVQPIRPSYGSIST